MYQQIHDFIFKKLILECRFTIYIYLQKFQIYRTKMISSKLLIFRTII